jgi:peroxiredoxin
VVEGRTIVVNLKAEITRLRQEQEESLSEDVRRLLQRSVQRLVESELAESAVGAGELFPWFSLPNPAGDAVNSEELLQQGHLVVCFYRGGWCPYCNLELRAYQATVEEIHEQGAILIAISPQLPDEGLTTAAKGNLTYQVLSDTGNSLASHLGLVFELAPAVADLYRSVGYDLERINGNKSWTLPVPATYVVQKDGLIVDAFIQPDHTIRKEPSEIIDILKQL